MDIRCTEVEAKGGYKESWWEENNWWIVSFILILFFLIGLMVI